MISKNQFYSWILIANFIHDFELVISFMILD